MAEDGSNAKRRTLVWRQEAGFVEVGKTADLCKNEDGPDVAMSLSLCKLQPWELSLVKTVCKSWNSPAFTELYHVQGIEKGPWIIQDLVGNFWLHDLRQLIMFNIDQNKWLRLKVNLPAQPFWTLAYARDGLMIFISQKVTHPDAPHWIVTGNPLRNDWKLIEIPFRFSQYLSGKCFLVGEQSKRLVVVPVPKSYIDRVTPMVYHFSTDTWELATQSPVMKKDWGSAVDYEAGVMHFVADAGMELVTYHVEQDIWQSTCCSACVGVEVGKSLWPDLTSVQACVVGNRLLLVGIQEVGRIHVQLVIWEKVGKRWKWLASRFVVKEDKIGLRHQRCVSDGNKKLWIEVGSSELLMVCYDLELRKWSTLPSPPKRTQRWLAYTSLDYNRVQV